MNYWRSDYELVKKIIGRKRTVQEAYNYLRDNYSGETRKALIHQMYERTPTDSTNEMKLNIILKDMIKGGRGKERLGTDEILHQTKQNKTEIVKFCSC